MSLWFAIIILLLVGLVSATFGSIVGLGGGIIIVPCLLLLGPLIVGGGIAHEVAVGTSLTVLIVTSLASTLTYAKRKVIDYRSALLLFITSGPAAMIGSLLTGYMPKATFQLVFGFFALAMVGLLIARDYMRPLRINWRYQRTFTDARGELHEYGYSVLPMLGFGLLVGFASGLFGIGGGSLFVPIMVLLFGFPPHLAAATSMFVILLSSILGSGVHAFVGDVNLWLVLALVPGAWFGGKLGANIASRMTGKALLWVLRVTLMLLGADLIIEGFISL